MERDRSNYDNVISIEANDSVFDHLLQIFDLSNILKFISRNCQKYKKLISRI